MFNTAKEIRGGESHQGYYGSIQNTLLLKMGTLASPHKNFQTKKHKYPTLLPYYVFIFSFKDFNAYKLSESVAF